LFIKIDDNLSDQSFQSSNSKLNYVSNSSFIEFNENCAATIDEHTFNLFEFDKIVGRDNTLSAITSYIFISLGLFTMFNYQKFEKFVDTIHHGYNKYIPYHNDLHAADVVQTCYIYLKYGNIIQVTRF
jgi:hypothetical protein